MDIQQAFNLASAKAFPGLFTEIMHGLTYKSPDAIFLFDQNPDGSTILANATMPEAERQKRADSLVLKGFAPLMLFELCWRGSDHFEVFSQWESDGIKWYPPRYVNGVLQPNLGEPGQFALPNAFETDAGLLGPYPTTKPDGWISIPPVSKLLVDGADVPALLQGFFGGKS